MDRRINAMTPKTGNWEPAALDRSRDAGHNGGVSDAAPGRFAFLRHPLFGKAVLALAALAIAGAAGWWRLQAKPEFDTLMLHANVTQDLFALYDLQMAYRDKYGAFADDLELLLKTAPDGGTALRARLHAHAHAETLVVAGDAEKFKLEANARDAARTLIRVKGPRVGVPIPQP